MAGYRYLPIPSDRMGFLWAVTGIPGVEILEFGPMGTTNFATRHMGEAPIYTTHIRDSVLTFGDGRPLALALEELEARRKPSVICVMQSAVTSIIGFDMEAFCREQQPARKARLVPVSLSGLSGDYTEGLALGMRTLLEACGKKQAKRRRVFHLLGAAIDDYRIQPDVEELCRLMAEAFGLEPGLILPCRASLPELEAAGGGWISLALRREAVPAARYLQETAGVPYVAGAPYGLEGTEAWLRQVGTCLGIPPREAFIRQEQEAGRQLGKPRQTSACLVSGYSMAKGLSAFLRREWGMEVKAFAFEKREPEPDSGVEAYREDAVDRWVRQKRPELLLGNSVITERDFGYQAIRLPVKKPWGIPNLDPPPREGFLGFQGYRNLLSAIR